METTTGQTTAGDLLVNMRELAAHLIAAPLVAFALIVIVAGLVYVASLERR